METPSRAIKNMHKFWIQVPQNPVDSMVIDKEMNFASGYDVVEKEMKNLK
jgi:hypothetical protein